MGRISRSIAFVLAASWVSFAAASSLSMWVAPSLERVSPAGQPGLNRNIDLAAARGETESFQILLRTNGTGAQNVAIRFSDLLDASNRSIPASTMEIYSERCVSVAPGSPDLDGSNRPLGAGEYPDVLVPVKSGAGASLVPGRTQGIWVDVTVPRNAVAGNYRGWFTASAGNDSVKGEIHLTVWRFALPRAPALKSSFGIEGSQRAATAQLLARNRLAPAVIDPAGERELIARFGLSAIGLGFWSGANYGHCSMSPPPSVEAIRAAKVKHQPGLTIYNYTADEIDGCENLIAPLWAWARNLHRAGVLNLVTMTPVPELLDDATGRPAVDIWVLLPAMFDKAPAAIAQARRHGGRIWSYNALSQDSYSPKWLIDYAPANFRIQSGFLSEALGLSGILYWRTDLWSGQWDSVNNFGKFGDYNAPGEGLLVYPGQSAGIHAVLPSMRLKWIRDGVDDYDYVELLRQQGRLDWALETIQPVARDWHNWSQDPGVLEKVRRELGSELDRLAAANAD